MYYSYSFRAYLPSDPEALTDEEDYHEDPDVDETLDDPDSEWPDQLPPELAELASPLPTIPLSPG